MNTKRVLQFWFVLVLAAMTWVSIYATLDGFSGQTRNVMIGFKDVWNMPWGMATLFDAYFAFVAFWLWVAYKESRILVSVLWLLAILAFGNFAIAAYVLIELARLKEGEGFQTLLIRKN